MYVGDAVLVALGDNFGAFFEWLAIVRARAGAAAHTTLQENNFTGAVGSNWNGHGADQAFVAIVFFFQVRTFGVHQLHHKSKDDGGGDYAGRDRNRQGEERFKTGARREDVADAAEPGQERHGAGGVEPRNGRAAAR